MDDEADERSKVTEDIVDMLADPSCQFCNQVQAVNKTMVDEATETSNNWDLDSIDAR